ncbi:twin-arginine translocase TatA/TatE family subunit [Temperatibacter marinus]|uniref:Sec-independent protein translocase protein TatA n=1 Tax=Temperatibacter marinus TaxID=1456591 RepID=A0AA52EDD0_9PROT|nr:twin-arginine translocase TatA/TatE family subunit [Temperatibacter marinus]WND02625.1 twin-arginine translocase TatA/TatE family subunit [Temperatibacter marinus]
MLGTWQIVIIAVLVILLFGRGKIAGLMGEVARGITSFRKGMKEGSETVNETPKQVDDQSDAPVVETTAKEKEKSE